MNISQQVKMIQDAINSAESSLNLAKNLLYQLSGDDYRRDNRRDDRRDDHHRPMGGGMMNRSDRSSGSSVAAAPKGNVEQRRSDPSREIVGIFNGLEMVTTIGKKFVVPHNYIAKSMIVEGDTLKFVRDQNEEKFKQIKRVKRNRLVGTLTKKDGEYSAVTELGSYKVLPEGVDFWKLKEGDNFTILVPSEGKAIWAAIEGLAKEEKKDDTADIQSTVTIPAPQKAVEPKKEEIKTEEKVVEEKVSEEKKDSEELIYSKSTEIPLESVQHLIKKEETDKASQEVTEIVAAPAPKKKAKKDDVDDEALQ